MSVHFERAQVLIEQSRYRQAENELRLELAGRPDDPLAHALLAYCLLEQNKPAEGLREAKEGVHLGPEMALCHYMLARAYYGQRQFDLAQRAVEEALRLDPEDPDYFALLAGLHLDRRRWSEALQSAERGLRVDPEHVASTNLRAIALAQMGQKGDAQAAVEAALAKEPENALTHANMGWTLLRRNDHVKALEHFREALRLDPELDWAREGIVEALKARNVVYRLMLRYFFWMSRLSAGAQWGIIIGGVILVRVLRGMAKDHPHLAPIFWPLIGLYFAFVVLTWTAHPLFNLLLRLHPFGRLALSREQLVASNWVGACLVAALLGLGIGLATAATPAYLTAAICGAMILPVAGTFNAERGRGRNFLTLYTMALGGVGCLAVGVSVSGGEVGVPGGVFLLGWIAFGWVANLVILKS